MIEKHEPLQELADTIREIYYRERNRWHWENEKRRTTYGSADVSRYDGGTDDMGRKHSSVWLKVAKMVYDHRLDPSRYVRAQFEIRKVRPIEPTQLNNRRALDLYIEAAQKESTDTLKIFHAQQRSLVSALSEMAVRKTMFGWNDTQILRAALGNNTLRMSALFRFCVAHKEGYEDIAEVYHEAATRQYLVHPQSYDLVWKEWIPDSFRLEAIGERRPEEENEQQMQEAPPGPLAIGQRPVLID